MTPAQHRRAVMAWRAAREARLRDPDGWLALVGLHWLEPGANSFGSDPGNDLVLRGADLPARVGSLLLADGEVRLRREGEEDAVMQPDVSGEPTIVRLGTLRMHVIKRGRRWALRVRDVEAPALAAFRGMESFEVDPSWRIDARFEPAPAGTTVEIVDVTGGVDHEPISGTVTFERDGGTWRLQALPGDVDGSLWLIFADATNGRATYGGGRYLYTEPVSGAGVVTVDFNLAYNPPCVFSSFATCPLPPAANRLGLAIEAGERAYHPPAVPDAGRD